MLEENNYLNPPTEELTPLDVVLPENTNIEFDKIDHEKQEKKEIRKLALVMGFPLLFLLGIGFVFTLGYLAIAILVFGISYNDAVDFLNNPAVSQILQITLSCLMFLLPFTVAVKCIGKRIDRTVDLALPKKGTAIPFFLFGIGFCAFSNVASSYASGIFERFGVDYSVPDSETPEGIFGFLLTFIAIAIVPALVEEFACRGIVLGLLKKHGETFAIVTSAIVFGIMHGNFEQMPFATLVGLVLGYIYVKTGSLWVGVAVHFINNAISVVFSYLETMLPTNMLNLSYLIYLIVALLSAIFGVLLFTKGNEDYDLAKPEGAVAEKQKYKWFFTSPLIILFIIFNFIESLMFFDFSSIINGILGKVGN